MLNFEGSFLKDKNSILKKSLNKLKPAI